MFFLQEFQQPLHVLCLNKPDFGPSWLQGVSRRSLWLRMRSQGRFNDKFGRSKEREAGVIDLVAY